MELTTSAELLDSLRAVSVDTARNAYVPYSGFLVGAAASTPGGDIYRGCNIENASFGMTLCAEASLIGSLVAHGGKGIEVICCRTADGTFLAPCGRCRQMIMEIGGPDCLVDLGNELVPIRTLLPHAFTGRDMNVETS
ncbi:cytidine deaminase [Lentzea atacamensis]|uniref:Cytidine deaminase n=1 Tax=Lentzea atacamensis TaxID=531938 RepID=A0ABX9EI77_9PSEU|nr:cytidine deaminase [Lentzea atacamensis]RAS69745.1 cytidine deaminase [Lentzea atacamensis]